eukprot:jgi/Picre1/29121/NNA_004514.t1
MVTKRRVHLFTLIATFFQVAFCRDTVSIAEGHLADGEYVIEVAGGSCSGKYLSYKPYGTEYPAVVRMKSAWAKRKPVWVIRKARPGVFTIEAQQRAKGYPAKLSYSFSDERRPNVFLNNRGLLSWEILPQGRTGEYFIFTHHLHKDMDDKGGLLRKGQCWQHSYLMGTVEGQHCF